MGPKIQVSVICEGNFLLIFLVTVKRVFSSHQYCIRLPSFLPFSTAQAKNQRPIGNSVTAMVPRTHNCGTIMSRP